MDVSSIMHGDMITDVRSLIAQWQTRQEFADAVGQPLERVHKWAQNNAIPAWHQKRVLSACKASGVAVSADQLITMHAAAPENGTAA